MSPVEKSLANLISSWKKLATQWSNMIYFREVISEAHRETQSEGSNRVGTTSAFLIPQSPTSYLGCTVCLINNCWWINEWMSGNYFLYFKKPSMTSTLASIRLSVPNKIAHFFPFLLEWYQLSVLMLSTRHADQKLWLVPDDITSLVSRALGQINAVPKSN